MPKVDLADVPCTGYEPHKFDFPELHARLDPAVQGLIQTMIEAAVTAEAFPDQGRYCHITVVGHSDRNDSPGLSAEARRADERQFSELRAESAQAWFFNEVFTRLQAEGHVAPVDMASMRNVDIETVACGSAILEHPTPASEDQRRVNRRVHFVGTIFTPAP